MEIQIIRTPQAHVIQLSGRWDTFSAPDFEQQCTRLADEETLCRVVLDLSRVDYVSSFGLRGLLNLGRRLEAVKGRLHVAALRPAVRKIFIGSGFNSLFPEFADVNAALQAFGD